MSNSTAVKAVVVSSTNAGDNQESMQLVLVNPDGTAASTVKKQGAQADSTATDVPGLKTDFNALLAKLRLAGVIS
jgi:O-glycosyl hydrolase